MMILLESLGNCDGYVFIFYLLFESMVLRLLLIWEILFFGCWEGFLPLLANLPNAVDMNFIIEKWIR